MGLRTMHLIHFEALSEVLLILICVIKYVTIVAVGTSSSLSVTRSSANRHEIAVALPLISTTSPRQISEA